MKFPGIEDGILSNLDEEDVKSVLDHIKKVKEAIKRKKDLVEGNIAELTEVNPENEIEKLDKALKEAEEDEVLTEDIENLKSSAEKLLESIDKEYGMMKKVEDYEGGDVKKLQGEMQNEIIIGVTIEHQLNLLYNIRDKSRAAIKEAVKLDEPHKSKVGNAVESLNDISSYIVSTIFEEELPHLSVAYNTLRLEEWPEIEKDIKEIQTRFENLEPKEP